MDNFYAGIGSRETPEHVLTILHHLGAYLADQGWTLRSGAASGADKAFEDGADIQGSTKEIWLPWEGFNFSKSELHPQAYPFSDQERAFAAKYHPAWSKCSPSARLMHQRNTRQILGCEQYHGEVIKPSKFIVCWTPGGRVTGGTGQALRIAQALSIPIINLGSATSNQEQESLVLKLDELQNKLKDRKVIG